MRNTNKKGFTIVELVIVIAVIAILSAVLIPTFAGIIDRANQSADQQAVANMNKLLAMNDKADDVDGVIEILVKEGYKGDLSTYFKGYKLAWLASENVIVLVEGDAVVYPKANAGATGYEEINPMASSVEDVLNALVNGGSIYVSDNIEASSANDFAFSEGKEYKIVLNGNKLFTNVANTNRGYKDGIVADGSAIVIISDGTVEGGSEVEQAVAAYGNSKLTIENSVVTGGSAIAVLAEAGGTVTIKDSVVHGNGINPVQAYGGTLILENVTIVQSGENPDRESWYDSAIQVANTIEMVNGAWKFMGNDAFLVVDGGNYTGKVALQINSPGGNVIINDGVFTGSNGKAINGGVSSYTAEGAECSITINGGTFNGNITVTADTELVINGGTFNCDTMTWDWLSQFVTAGKTVVLNGTSYTK